MATRKTIPKKPVLSAPTNLTGNKPRFMVIYEIDDEADFKECYERDGADLRDAVESAIDLEYATVVKCTLEIPPRQQTVIEII